MIGADTLCVINFHIMATLIGCSQEVFLSILVHVLLVFQAIYLLCKTTNSRITLNIWVTIVVFDCCNKICFKQSLLVSLPEESQSLFETLQ